MNYYAQPRMTRDIDVVVALTSAEAEVVVRLFEGDFYLDPETVARAIVIKVDFIVRKDDPYRLEEFARRQEILIKDFHTWIVSREDLILSKLVWAKDSGSEIQLKDARNLLVRECDTGYLRSRAGLLSVLGLFEDLGKRHG
jgi:hypothetical protein